MQINNDKAKTAIESAAKLADAGKFAEAGKALRAAQAKADPAWRPYYRRIARQWERKAKSKHPVKSKPAHSPTKRKLSPVEAAAVPAVA